MNAQALVQLTGSGAIFTHFADDVVRALRKKMYVPEHADDDVEAEFSTFRVSLDAHYPAFCQLFASCLSDQLGPSRLEGSLSALNTESAQRYLQTAARIERELEQSVPRLKQELTATAQVALLGSEAPGDPPARALSLARATGAYTFLHGLAQATTQQALSSERDAAADPLPMSSPEAQRLRCAVLSKLLGFHGRVFVHHVGQGHAAAVVAELQREPLSSYVRARSAMKPVLDRGLRELAVRIMKEVLRHDCH